MARPEKEGIDYYPLEVGVLKERRMHSMIKRYGSDAVSVFIHILNECYSNKGYYLVLDSDFYDFASDILLITEERLDEIIEALCEKGFFTIIEYDGRIILTSEGIQQRFQNIVKGLRRKTPFSPIKELWLLENNEHDFTRNNPEKVEFPTSKTSQKPPESTQTKTNKTKEKEIKSNKTKADDSDGFNKPFSDQMVEMMKSGGATIYKNTNERIREMEAKYDRRAIKEALETAMSKQGVRSVISYANTILESWSKGSGSPKWVEAEEKRLQAEKSEYMKPGAIVRQYMR